MMKRAFFLLIVSSVVGTSLAGPLDQFLVESPNQNSICKQDTPSISEIEDYIYNYGSETKHSQRIGSLRLLNEKEAVADAFKALFKDSDIVASVLNIFGRSNLNFPGDTSCTSIRCALESVWPGNIGLKILYMELRYGFNLSEYSKKSASRSFSEEEVDSIIAASADLGDRFFEDIGSFGFSPPSVTLDNASGRAGHAVGSSITVSTQYWGGSIYSSYQKQRTMIHEFAHVFSNNGGNQRDWQRAHGGENCYVSTYAETNNKEDLAESVVAYRYHGQEFKDRCPMKYRATRRIVFHGKEFLNQNNCE